MLPLESADPSTKLRDRLGPDPIELDADRKVLKLLLNLMHQVSMPAAFIWKVHAPLFALCDEVGCDSVVQLALASFAGCVDRDPWRMFSVASERNNVALARAALGALAAAEDKMQAAATNQHQGNGYHQPNFSMELGKGYNPYANSNGLNGFPGYNGFPNGFGFPGGSMNTGPNGFPKGLNGGYYAHLGAGAPQTGLNGFPTPGNKGKKNKGKKQAGAGELDFASLNMIMSKAGDDKVSERL